MQLYLLNSGLSVSANLKYLPSVERKLMLLVQDYGENMNI